MPPVTETVYDRIAAAIEDLARYERGRNPIRLKQAAECYPHLIRPCEACKKGRLSCGGLCPECLDIIARVLRERAERRRKDGA